LKHEKQDRRSRRTRGLVIAALMELMRERRYDTITVGDLLERSGIGRSTFYAHFFNKDDALAGLIGEQLALLNEQLKRRTKGQGLVPSLELFQHVQENAALFRALVRGRAGEAAWEATRDLLRQDLEQGLVAAAAAHDPSVPLPVITNYVISAFEHLLKWWITADMPYSPEEMENYFERLVLSGVSAALGSPSAYQSLSSGHSKSP
jgi:AcrR family transcriptional regulator